MLEILLALAIIALLGTVLISGADRLLSEEPVTAHEIFWKAVLEARKAALKAEHDIRLKYDKEKKQFVIVDGLAPSTVAADGSPIEEVPLKVFPVPPAAASDDFSVEFLPVASKNAQMILVGGVAVETQTVTYVTFYSDGTCMPFRAQFFRNAGTNTLAIDPWTCAPMLTPPDPNAPPLP